MCLLNPQHFSKLKHTRLDLVLHYRRIEWPWTARASKHVNSTEALMHFGINITKNHQMFIPFALYLTSDLLCLTSCILTFHFLNWRNFSHYEELMFFFYMLSSIGMRDVVTLQVLTVFLLFFLHIFDTCRTGQI